MPRRAKLCALCCVLLSGARGAAQSDAGARRPDTEVEVPGLDARAQLGSDGRTWHVSTRVSPEGMQVTASANDGALAVLVRRSAREAIAGCRSQLAAALGAGPGELPRPSQVSVFRGALWADEVVRVSSNTHDLEWSCLRAQTEYWVVTAVARPSSGVTLLDAEPAAQRLGAALARERVRGGWPLRLAQLGIELGDPGGGGTWLFTGRGSEVGFASEALSTSAGAPGGVTVQLGRRAGSCGDLWDVLRPQVQDFGNEVDRPGYVPALFGARGRRVVLGERTREWFCGERGGVAWLASTVFRTDDGDALTHGGAALRAAARGIVEATPEPTRDAGAPDVVRGRILSE